MPNPTLSEAATLMGRVRSEKKAMASRRNLAKARATRQQNFAMLRMWKQAESEIVPAIRRPDGMVFASGRYNPVRLPFYRRAQFELYQLLVKAGEGGYSRSALATILKLKYPRSSVITLRQALSQFLYEARRRELIREETGP